MDDKDVHSTAFFTYKKLWKYCRILFWLGNIQAMIYRVSDFTMTTAKWQHAIVYINDIVIFLKAPEQSLQHEKEVLLLM